MGVHGDTVYQPGPTIDLKTGDILLLLTDGVTEAGRMDGEMFGSQRVRDVVNEHRQSTASAIAEALLEATSRFCHPLTPQDDVTILLQKVL